MHYLGGKYRLRKKISNYLTSLRKTGQIYREPFVGAAWVLQEMFGRRVASDISEPLITLFKALQDGWIPPEVVSEDLYNEYKEIRPEGDPLTGFIGFGCSFSGKYFGGYARDPKSDRNYALNAKNSLLRQLPKILDVDFYCVDYSDIVPVKELIYCDPPYKGYTRYTFPFDHDKFWDVMREWSKESIVIISEYSAPEDFECVLEMPTRLDMNAQKGKKRMERLFRLRE